jgi:hypothetical protein
MRTPDADPVPALAELSFHILLALGDGPSHGYAIGQCVEEESGGRLDPTTGALYQALRRPRLPSAERHPHDRLERAVHR